MRHFPKTACALLSLAMFGCGHIDFGGDGLTYFEPRPYLFVSTTKECVTTATVLTLPDTKKTLKFVPGYGSSDLSVTLSNGMLVAVGQKTDTKIPETLSSLAGLATAVAKVPVAAAAGKQVICTPTATLYPIIAGVPDETHPVAFPVPKEIVDLGIEAK